MVDGPDDRSCNGCSAVGRREGTATLPELHAVALVEFERDYVLAVADRERLAVGQFAPVMSVPSAATVRKPWGTWA